jgi:manganese-dependent ADP-ribose/CDP-alcohol diphosphatase
VTRRGLVLGAAGMRAKAAPPPFTFGAIADVQYADQETKGPREYRRSAGKLAQCAAALAGEHPAFTVQLGDLVDGGLANLDRILPIFRKLPGKVYSVLGNHDFCAPRPELLERLAMPAAYYTFSRPGWRFIVLDGMDASIAGWPEGHPRRAEGEAVLARLRAAKERNAQPWNGGLGSEQREWLRRALADAAKNRERAIVFCHFPVLAEACRPEHLLWDHRETLEILEASRAAAAWINGHDHKGGYAVRNGIHHLTLPGMVEHDALAGCKAVDVLGDRLVVRTAGEKSGQTLQLR